jgi:hypothetical protein
MSIDQLRGAPIVLERARNRVAGVDAVKSACLRVGEPGPVEALEQAGSAGVLLAQ